MGRQSGFTLVELVTTVAVIGVLAAVAIPRFTNNASDARAGVIKNLAQTMRQANETIYSKASAGGITGLSSTSSSAVVNVSDGKGGSVAITTHYGYAKDATNLYAAMSANPALVVGADGVAVGTERADVLAYNSADVTASTVVGANGAIQFGKAAIPTKCEVGYNQAANASTAPQYIVVVTDCS